MSASEVSSARKPAPSQPAFARTWSAAVRYPVPTLTWLLLKPALWALDKAGWSEPQRVRDDLADSPSLRPYVEQVLGTCYQDARKAAADESGVPRATFPAVCPFSENQILDAEFLPE